MTMKSSSPLPPSSSHKSSSTTTPSTNSSKNKDAISRICIKNIPPSCTESKLQSHLTSLSSTIIITDCKILRTKDGKSRKLAFVGFKSPNMAQQVVSYFHKTYYGTSKLIVELAFSKNSNDKKGDYRPWSKYSIGSSRHDSLQKKSHDRSKNAGDGEDDNNYDYDKAEKQKQNEKIDKKKEEFLQVMMGSKKGSGKVWGNDDGGRDNNDEDDEDDENQMSDESDSQSSNSSSSAPTSSDDDDDDNDDNNDDYTINAINNVNQRENPNKKLQETKKVDDEYSSDRLFLRNLPFNATEDEIREVFANYGTIVECHIPIDDSNRSKGYAFVKYDSSRDAFKAREELDGSSFQGRLIHVLRARPERDNNNETRLGTAAAVTTTVTGSEMSSSTTTHKQKVEQERRKEAEHTTKGWSTNFVRGDAVVDNLAARFGMDKGDVLNVKNSLSSGDAAVRLALGETQVLEENREYFQKHGIEMDALISSSASKSSDESTTTMKRRSNTMILVKNLPYDTAHDELTRVFLGFGGDATILLPPSKTIALIKYTNINDAKKAFRKLAYKRFKHVPLYLEWAPLNAVSNSTNNPVGKPNIDKEVSHDNDDDDDDDFGESGQGLTTIYVKNLKFSTSESDLKKVFQEVAGKENILSVRIPTKVAPVKPAQGKVAAPKVQSMGYGFVECRSEDVAKRAIRHLRGTVINGHAMELKISSKVAATGGPSSLRKNEKKGTKLMVRNVPFQASRTEILQLFGSFGQLKTVRLPKKFDGGHRGFAFVEFTSVKEAQNAMNTLSQTHLYGRHLVIEWSNEKGENDQSGPTKHKADDMPGGAMSQSKRIKFT